MSAGIDYGMGQTNIDHETGIRYGVIHSGEVCQAWCDSAESYYGEPHCPKCGNEARTVKTKTESSDPPGQWVSVIADEEFPDDYEQDGWEYACDDCKYTFDADDAYGDEPVAWTLDDGEYQAEQGGDDCDIFITKSPYFTRAKFCSPCAPGACYLMNPTDDGERAYCFGHDWFDGGQAPYPVYSVATGELVNPE